MSHGFRKVLQNHLTRKLCFELQSSLMFSVHVTTEKGLWLGQHYCPGEQLVI